MEDYIIVTDSKIILSLSDLRKNRETTFGEKRKISV